MSDGSSRSAPPPTIWCGCPSYWRCRHERAGGLPVDRQLWADLWDRSYLDLGEQATIAIGADNHGEIALGALQGGLDVSYGPNMVFFAWAGFDEMDEVTGDGRRGFRSGWSL
ncbi:hypothetical protein EN859_024260 [Mesorhizobium sp. M00.F.Ca.ET.216.01.1.1]|nr:hypothetical protein EN859_024260 [Mesorhizobium sp. M00.F.Ca.ET.216.01.1.1]TJW09197.1 MAG: hypothetical protein E5W82_22455 [Mesorhizobium sp.]